jgi:hypothetical protein
MLNPKEAHEIESGRRVGPRQGSDLRRPPCIRGLAEVETNANGNAGCRIYGWRRGVIDRWWSIVSWRRSRVVSRRHISHSGWVGMPSPLAPLMPCMFAPFVLVPRAPVPTALVIVIMSPRRSRHHERSEDTEGTECQLAHDHPLTSITVQLGNIDIPGVHCGRNAALSGY